MRVLESLKGGKREADDRSRSVISALKHIRRERLSDEHIEALISMIVRAAPTEGPKLLVELVDRFTKSYGESDLFAVVLPGRQTSDDLAKARARHFEIVSGKNARLLELGPWSAWPDQRVRQFLQSTPSATGGFSEFIRLDFDADHAPDLVASCSQVPLADGSVDFVRSNSLLEHVKDTLGTIQECFRVLAPGGVVQHTMPLHFHLHGYPKDYSRLSPDYFYEVYNDIGFEDVVVHVRTSAGRIYTCLNTMNSFGVSEIGPQQRVLLEFVKATLLLLSELDFADSGMEAVAHSIHALARKSGNLTPRTALRKMDGTLVIADGTSTVSRIAADIVHPTKRTSLKYSGTAFLDEEAGESFPVMDGSAFLRETDSVSVKKEGLPGLV
jgi:SAM-dependent methyltransferase